MSSLGGKADKLLRLQELGFPVPPFIVIASHDLESGAFNFKEALQPLHPDRLYAVRSSATAEDGANFSFAGQFETELYVPFHLLEETILKIHASGKSDRVQTYLKTHGIESFGGVSVIVQAMIAADVSGVAFGAEPLTGSIQNPVINAVYGLGEGLVSGELTADVFTKGKAAIIYTKDRKLEFDELKGFGTRYVEVEDSLQTIPSLNLELQNKIFDWLRSLELAFGAPQDIEFAVENEALYLLQTRPITTKIARNPIIWDNSNIIESYPGLTSPLTFSFIEKMYESVYRQLSAVMGIPKSTIDANGDTFANMLGLLNGRVYYNLNAWFGALSLLPGYSLNADFMERMMGVKEKFPLEVPKQPGGIKAYWGIARAIFSVVKNLTTINKQRIHFQQHFNLVMAKYEALNLDQLSEQKLVEAYLEFEQTLVKEWKAPLVNDFFAMVYFGLMQKNALKLVPENELIHNDLLIGSNDIISTEPITRSLALVETIRANEELEKCFKEKSPQDVIVALENPNFSDFKTSFYAYIHKWGDRTVGELKLENITYRQDPSGYVRVLQSYLQSGASAEQFDHLAGLKIRTEAEHLIYSKLKGKAIKKKLFKHLLSKARYLVSNRENLRFERTRGFGMVRRLFLALGQKLEKAKKLTQARDVFFLSQPQIFSLVNGSLSPTDAESIIQKAKVNYAEWEQFQLPERVLTDGKNFDDLPVEPIQVGEKSGLSQLKGIGCCAGIVEATVRVLHSPNEADTLNGDILVTSSTDPGWVTLFPSCSAILVERGSLLSHSAIVSREMGIPCIVGIKNLLSTLETGDLVRMNGRTGEVEILKRASNG